MFNGFLKWNVDKNYVVWWEGFWQKRIIIGKKKTNAMLFIKLKWSEVK